MSIAKSKGSFWKDLKPYIKYLLIVAGITMFLMLLAYPILICSGILSGEDFGRFGEYFGSIVAMANTIAILFLGYIVYKAQNKRDDYDFYYKAVKERPILRFISVNGSHYRLYNMGKGAANKVIIGLISTDENEIKKPTSKGYSIPSRAYLLVSWTSEVGTLYAYYEGNPDERYLVKCNKDENTDMNDFDQDETIRVEGILKKFADRNEKIEILSY